MDSFGRSTKPLDDLSERVDIASRFKTPVLATKFGDVLRHTPRNSRTSLSCCARGDYRLDLTLVFLLKLKRAPQGVEYF